eukprot:SAG31_NODE_40613_length_280_cov_0.569061_1_plen_32_part_01
MACYYESQKDLLGNIQNVACTYAPVFELIEET